MEVKGNGTGRVNSTGRRRGMDRGMDEDIMRHIDKLAATRAATTMVTMK